MMNLEKWSTVHANEGSGLTAELANPVCDREHPRPNGWVAGKLNPSTGWYLTW